MNFFVYAFIGLFGLGDTTAVDTTMASDCIALQEKLYLNAVLELPDETDTYIDSLLSCGRDSSENLLAAAKYFYHQNDFEESVHYLNRALNQRDNTVQQYGEACYYMSLISYYYKLDDYSLKYSSLQIEKKYRPEWAYITMGLVYESQKKYKDALTYYKKAANTDPGNPKAYGYLANLYGDLYEYRDALKCYLIADSLSDHHRSAYQSGIITSMMYLDKEQKEIHKAAENAFRLFPNDRDIIRLYATSLARLGKYDEAREQAHRILELPIRSDMDWFDIAYLYGELGERDSSYYYYLVTLQMNDRNGRAHHNIGIIYTESGFFKEGLEHYNQALEINPMNANVYNSKINAYIWQYDFDSAYVWASKFLEKFPQDEDAYDQMGYVLMLLKKYKKAIPHFVTALKYLPGDDRLVNNIANCYAHMGERKLAMQLFDSALAMNPENSFIYHNRAVLYCDMGDSSHACADLKTAMDKGYYWIIDDELIKMKELYCPNVNTDIKILVYGFKKDPKAEINRRFIQLNDSIINANQENLIKNFADTASAQFELKTGGTFDSYWVYTNPGTGRITVEQAKVMWESVTVKVYDSTGKTIYADTLKEKKKEIDLSAYAKGDYVVMFSNDRSVLSVKKVKLSK